jgi:putative transposase
VGRKRLARLRRAAGLVGVSRRKAFHTTVREHNAAAAPDPIERDFTETAPDRLWAADTPYVPTWAGLLYLAVVVVVVSRKCAASVPQDCRLKEEGVGLFS